MMSTTIGQPCDPAVHIFCLRLAYRLVGIVQPCLRPEEVAEAAREFYSAIRDDLEQFERANRKGVQDGDDGIHRQG